MYQKYVSGQFGVCPRVLCEKVPLLPVGMSNEPRSSWVKVINAIIQVYCLKCNEAYTIKDKNVNLDGAYFGTSLPQAFALVQQKIIQAYAGLIEYKEPQKYVPKIFGFKVAKDNASVVKDFSKEAN